MRVAIFDIETTGFYANSSIMLCCAIKEVGKQGVKVFRGDKYPEWQKHRTNDSGIVKDVLEYLDDFDIVVAHNGEAFDKTYLTTKALKYGYKPILREKKSIDPVLASRRHLRLGRNSLAQLIEHLGISTKKTHVDISLWLKAGIEGDRKAMDYIVHHCIVDVHTLQKVYWKLRPLFTKIDNRGSAY